VSSIRPELMAEGSRTGRVRGLNWIHLGLQKRERRVSHWGINRSKESIKG
jgi:hypothetical protein